MCDPRPRKGEGAGGEVSPPTVTPVLVAELLAEGERMPVYVHVVDHPDARVLVDTGMTQLHPAVADMDPRLIPLNAQADFDLASIDVVINTHLHFDHCGGNHLFTGRPIYVQRRELDDARSKDDYTIREWVEAPGVQYVPVDGALELLPASARPGARPHARLAGSRRQDGWAFSGHRRRHGGLLCRARRAAHRRPAAGPRPRP
jgi:N-acyl homoserine lactone hydrolase